MKEENFEEFYGNFSDLLGAFLFATYEPNQSDEETIVKFIKERTTEQVTETIKQGKEILALKDFPYELIGDISGRRPTLENMNPTKEDYYDWIKWIMEELEKEAKKQGKL